MPAQPGSQPAAGRSMGPPARRPASRAAAQPGRQTAFGLASEQPAGRRAGLLARQAARQLPARGQPVQTPENFRVFFYTSVCHFCETVTKNSQTPEKKKVRKKPCVAAGWPACQPHQPAGKPTGSTAISWPVSQQANCTTVHARRRLTGWPGSSRATSCPGVFSILSLLGSTRGGAWFFFFFGPKPRKQQLIGQSHIYIYIYIYIYNVPQPQHRY